MSVPKGNSLPPLHTTTVLLLCASILVAAGPSLFGYNRNLSDCCNGTLGYAWNEKKMPCSEMQCCNNSETVAVIHIDYAFGFCFRCLPKKSIRPQCYAAGTTVRSSEVDPDHTPRSCCDGAKFNITVNEWYAGMTIRCVQR